MSLSPFGSQAHISLEVSSLLCLCIHPKHNSNASAALIDFACVSLSLTAVRGLSGANGVSSTGSVPTMKSSRTEAVCDPPGSSGPEDGGSFVSFCIWTYE